ncbi:hypothetical protein GALL_66600 [mine drainage metagenome]|uniref:Uncharacterized protein n=1 Tax=mine drainage metagenome TaxID=410659 RepID=A0A1J5SV08_9ZZZZ
MTDSNSKLIRNSTAEFLIFTAPAGEQSIEARYEDQTVWLTRKLMAELFAVDVRTVSEHLKNIFSSGELGDDSVIRKFRITAADGKPYATNHYNLDAIISIGYLIVVASCAGHLDGRRSASCPVVRLVAFRLGQ